MSNKSRQSARGIVACRLILVLCVFLLASPSAFGQEKLTRWTLPTGLRVIFQPDANNDVVAICVFVKAGAIEDGGKPGIGNLTVQTLFGSNVNQSADAVARAIYGAGGGITTRWEPDYTLISCITVRDSFEDGMYQIAQALKNADMDAASLERARNDISRDLAKGDTDPFRVAYGLMRNWMYDELPYRFPFGGTQNELRRITRESVLAYYHRWYTPDNTVIAVVGNITEERARKSVDNCYLPDYDRPPGQRNPLPTLETLAESKRVEKRIVTKTTYLIAGFPGPGLLDADYAAYQVMTNVIGGGKSARLFKALRETSGLGYAVGAFTPALILQSHLLAYVEYDQSRSGADGKPINGASVEKLLVDTATSVVGDPPTEREVERAKKYTAGSFALQHQRARNRAAYLGMFEIMGRGAEFDVEYPKLIAAVTREDVLRVASKYLKNYVLAVIEPDSSK